MHIEDIVKSHWTKYGRNYYSRYDYENVPSDVANALFTSLRSSFTSLVGTKIGAYEVIVLCDDEGGG